jgi:hypothetical protein
MVHPIIVVVTGSSGYIKNLGTEGLGGNEPIGEEQWANKLPSYNR